MEGDKLPAGRPGDVDGTLRALRARTRREILALIWDREMAAGQIAAAFHLTPATISQHLAVLRDAGLVEMAKVGTSRRYRARQQALSGLHGAVEGAGKWSPASGIPERDLTSITTRLAVTVSVDVAIDVETAFGAFTDPELYSRWLQVPVSIEGNRFSATMEWGTEVRGRYDVVAPPHLIAMSWDFDDENVPVPGQPLIGYLRVGPTEGGSRVEVQQLVDTQVQADFMEAAWGVVLGRFLTNIDAVVSASGAAVRRGRRPKNAGED